MMVFVAVTLASDQSVFSILGWSEKLWKVINLEQWYSWSPDNSSLVSVGQDGRQDCNVGTQKNQNTEGGAQWVEYVSWSPSGDFFASMQARY